MKLKLVPIAVMGVALVAGVWMLASRWNKTAEDTSIVFRGKRSSTRAGSELGPGAASAQAIQFSDNAKRPGTELTPTKVDDGVSKIIAELKRMIEDEDSNGIAKALAGRKAVFARLLSSKKGKTVARKALGGLASAARGSGGPGLVAAVAAAVEAGDAEFTEDTVDALENVLWDFSLSDREKSALIVDVERSVTDPGLLNSLNMEIFGGMRRSVQAETLKAVLLEGTAAAKERITEAVEFVTDSADCSPAAIDAWKAANPDDPGDEEFYGGEREE